MDKIVSRIEKILIQNGMFQKNNENLTSSTFKEIVDEMTSLNLISFVVAIENEFNIELPDDFLNPENFSSLTLLCETIKILSNDI